MTKRTYVVNAYYKREACIELQEAEKRDDETFIGGTIKVYGKPINRWEFLFAESAIICYVSCNNFHEKEREREEISSRCATCLLDAICLENMTHKFRKSQDKVERRVKSISLSC